MNRISPDVIFHDEHLLVVNKASGLLSVPGRGEDKQDCLSARLQQSFPDALVVHRLDMATSGLMLFARGELMQRKLSRMFRERGVTKRYVALVAGVLEKELGLIDLPIIVDWPNRPRSKVDFESGKPSLTRYRLLGVSFDTASPTQDERNLVVSRVELEPITGRTHQLRLHLATIGHPILGDTLYEGRAAPRLMLHATHLAFVHPITAMPMHFEHVAPF